MNTLEYLVKLELDKGGYVYNQNMLKAAAEYIEMHNEHCDIDNTEDDWMTPAIWLSCCKENNPDMLIKKNDLYSKICYYLIDQRNLCIEQTGLKPSYDDYKQGMDCDEFRYKIGEGADILSIDDIFNFLLTYYEREGDIWNI